MVAVMVKLTLLILLNSMLVRVCSVQCLALLGTSKVSEELRSMRVRITRYRAPQGLQCQLGGSVIV